MKWISDNIVFILFFIVFTAGIIYEYADPPASLNDDEFFKERLRLADFCKNMPPFEASQTPIGNIGSKLNEEHAKRIPLEQRVNDCVRSCVADVEDRAAARKKRGDAMTDKDVVMLKQACGPLLSPFDNPPNVGVRQFKKDATSP